MIDGQKWAANLWVWNGPRYGLSSVDPETGRTVDLPPAIKGGKVVEPDPTFPVSSAARVTSLGTWFSSVILLLSHPTSPRYLI